MGSERRQGCLGKGSSSNGLQWVIEVSKVDMKEETQSESWKIPDSYDR